MAKQQISLKQLAINKDNSAIVIAVGVAAFVIVFSLVASNALLKQRSYQSKVIGQKKIALRQLKTNVTEVQKLQTSYQAFADSQQNILGGSSSGSGEKDGENPRLILDALPSKYDFPALTSSLSKVFGPYKLDSISGIDDEIAQAAASSAKSAPVPIEMPFTLTVNGDTQSVKTILKTFELSIRPIQIQKLAISGSSSQLKIDVTAKTYFQPQKKFDVKSEKVK